ASGPEVVPEPLPGAAVRRPDAEQEDVPPVQRMFRPVPDHEGHGHLVQATPAVVVRAHALLVPRGAAGRARGTPPTPGVHDARLSCAMRGRRAGKSAVDGPVRGRLEAPRGLRLL